MNKNDKYFVTHLGIIAFSILLGVSFGAWQHSDAALFFVLLSSWYVLEYLQECIEKKEEEIKLLGLIAKKKR